MHAVHGAGVIYARGSDWHACCSMHINLETESGGKIERQQTVNLTVGPLI